MNQPPPLIAYQQQIDIGHLRLLSVFHYVMAGLALLGILFIIAHYLFMHTMFSNPRMWQPGQGPPAEFLTMFKGFYIAGALICLIGLLANLASAIALRARRGRIFSIVIAGINCIHMPLGTLLGVFTIMVLSRESVKNLYPPS